jgi:hypothetical protein
VVLRLGRVVHDGPSEELTPIDLVHMMAGLSGRRETASTGAVAPTEA